MRAKLWWLRVLAAPALVAGLLAAPAVVGSSDPAPRVCQPQAPKSLEQAAVKVEDRGINARGNHVTRYYLPTASVNADGCISYDLTAYHEDGRAFAKSSEWYNSANGRYYWYQAATYIEHEVVGGTETPDKYYYGMLSDCWRRLGTTEVRNYCVFNNYVGLQTSGTGGEGSFTGSYGYNRVTSSSLRYWCDDDGGAHAIYDLTKAVRTWLWMDVDFYSDTGAFLHSALARKTVSYAIWAGTENPYSMVGTNQFIDAGNPPSPLATKPCGTA
jgi:hypothetical protein